MLYGIWNMEYGIEEGPESRLEWQVYSTQEKIVD